MRKKSKLIATKNAPILARIQAIKADHPFWGYRRIWAYIKYRDSFCVNQKRIYRLMKEHDLLVKKNQRLFAKRCSNKPKPRASKPNQFWGTDMTKIKLNAWGWIYLHIVIDWHTKEIIGYSVSTQSKTNDWLDALNDAVNTRFPEGIQANMPKLISDNGCQPTSIAYMKACNLLKIKQIFTTWNNPKGNADTERVMRTIKEDLVWTKDWDNPFLFETAFSDWIKSYNQDFPHQSLHYNTPFQFFENFQLKEVAKTLSF